MFTFFLILPNFYEYLVLKQNVDIDLSSYDKTNKSSNVFIRYLNLAQGNAVVNVRNVPNNQGFFVIQVHNLYANISLSTTPNLVPKTFITGTNIGLVQQNLDSTKTYQYYVQYREQPSFKILLTLVVYEKTGKRTIWFFARHGCRNVMG